MTRNLLLGTGLSSLVVLAALVSFIWTPFDHTAMDIPAKLQQPNGNHWLGTDHFGRDIFSMIMVGARTSIAVALVAVGIGMGLGVPLGLAAATTAVVATTTPTILWARSCRFCNEPPGFASPR